MKSLAFPFHVFVGKAKVKYARLLETMWKGEIFFFV